MRIEHGIRSSNWNDIRTQAATAESQGFDGVVTFELNNDPFMSLAIATTATQRVQLGTAGDSRSVWAHKLRVTMNGVSACPGLLRSLACGNIYTPCEQSGGVGKTMNRWIIAETIINSH